SSAASSEITSFEVLSTPSNPSNVSTEVINSGTGTGSTGGKTPFAVKKYSPAITLTTMRFQTASKNPDPWDEGAYIKWSKEKLGIIWKPKFTANDDQEARTKTLLLAAANDLPDVLPNLLPLDIYNLAKKGLLADVGDLVNKYGSPLLKYTYMEEYLKYTNNQGYDAVKVNGKIYALPQALDIMYSTVSLNIIRKDIVDQLGFTMPKTIADLDAIFAAYKAKYPTSYCIYTNSWNITIPQIFDVFGASPYAYVLKNGKYVPGATQPEAKAALAKLREWYSKGYINPKFAGNLSPWTGMANNQYLMAWGVPWGIYYNYQNSYKSMPNAQFVPIDFLQLATGKSGDHYYNFQTLWPAAISANSKFKEAIINDANACVDSFFRNDEELRTKFGNSYTLTPVQQASNPDEVKAKGMQYAIYKYPENSQGPGFFNRYNPAPVGIATVNVRAGTSIRYGGSVYDKYIANGRKFAKTLSVLTQDEKNFVMSQPYIQTAVPYSLKAFENTFLFYKYIGTAWNAGTIKLDESYNNQNIDAWNTYAGKFMPVLTNTWNKIMVGSLPLDDFDTLEAKFNAAGGDKFTADVNAYYKSVGIIK
ncbi:MAG: type 2 periplasmic-binding domain-containing protein, partial [Saccharofermentanales bacterium]